MIRKIFAIIMVAILLGAPVAGLSWKDPSLKSLDYHQVRNLVDNITQIQTVWFGSNISMILFATDLNFTHWVNDVYVGEAKNRSEDKAATILEMENQQAANLTHTENEIYIGTERNISLSVDGAASNLSHEVDAGAINLSEGKAAVLSTVSDWIQDPANKTEPYSPTGAPAIFNMSNMSVVTAPLYDVNGSWVIPDPGGGNAMIMDGADWGITPNSTLWLTGLYVKMHINVVPPFSCELWTGGPAQTWKIWRSPPSGAVELLGNVSVCDLPFGDYVNENQTWVGVRFAHPVMVTPDDIIGFHNDYTVMVSTNGSVPYDNNLAYYGDFSLGGIVPYSFGVDVIGTSDDPTFIARVAEDVVAVGDASTLTAAKGAAIKWASDSDTANRSGAENTASQMAAANASAAIKWASDSDTLNDTATKAAAIKTADDHISTNITTTADIRLMAYQFVTPASGGAAYSAPVEGGSGNIWVPIDFDGASSEAAVADIPLPSDYATGFTEAYSWTATSAGGGGVVWGTELACIADNAALDASWGTQVLVTDAFQTSGALHISPASAATTPSGTCLAGRTLAIRVKRMPAEVGDTMSDDARFLGMNLTFTKAGA